MEEGVEERTKIDALDLLISVLREHEKSLDLMVASLERQLNRLTDTVTRLEALGAKAAARPRRKHPGRREKPPERRPR